MNRGIAQLASVLAWGASGRAFESHYSDGSKPKQTSNYLAVCFLIYTLEDIVTQNNKHHFLQIFCKKIWRYRKWFLN